MTTPPILIHRAFIEHWPDFYREKWGRMANALEASGTPFPASEKQAFERIVQFMNSRENSPSCVST